MLFVDLESSEGQWLSAALTENITAVPEARIKACVAELGALWQLAVHRVNGRVISRVF